MQNPDTKLTGDISVQYAITIALERGWNVLAPIGDRLRYDLVFDVNGVMVKIQVKTAWHNAGTDRFIASTRMSKTNRKTYKVERYALKDFDFALVRVPANSVFYVIPINVFIAHKSQLSFNVNGKYTQRSSRVDDGFKENWNLITEYANNQLAR